MEQYWDNVRGQGVLPRPDSIRPFRKHHHKCLSTPRLRVQLPDTVTASSKRPQHALYLCTACPSRIICVAVT
jgi:hypothetical protein